MAVAALPQAGPCCSARCGMCPVASSGTFSPIAPRLFGCSSMGWWSVLDVKLAGESSLGKGGSQRKYPRSRADNRERCAWPDGGSGVPFTVPCSHSRVR